MTELRTGDRVEYRGSWGDGPARDGVITGSGVEAGELVYDVTLDSGLRCWGYANQFRLIQSHADKRWEYYKAVQA